jgi:hypothetical protein
MRGHAVPVLGIGEFADNIAREVQRGDGGVGRVFVNLAVTFAGFSIELGDTVVMWSASASPALRKPIPP